MNAESSKLARNMSAPPRTTLSFAALVPALGPTGDAVADGAGLTFVCRLDARALLPKARQNLGKTQLSQDLKYVHNRIRVALVYARAEAARHKRPPAGALKKACAAPVEDVTDALRDLLATESLADARLPLFGLLLPPHNTERAILRSFTRTLAILARRRGTLFLRDAEPIVWAAMAGQVLDLLDTDRGAWKRDMSARCDNAALVARIYSSFPVAQTAFARLLHLLDIEVADSVPTAAVTLGSRSRLLLNPKFVAENCPADHDLVMLILHELHHVALGHTRLFPKLTPAQNWAFDCVINAQLCRLYPEPHHTALFRRLYRADAIPQALLRPPEGWRTKQECWLPGRAGDLHRALYSDASVTYADLYQLLPALAAGDEDGFRLAPDRLLGDHGGAGERSDVAPDVLREMRNILAEWPMLERIAGRDQGGEALSSNLDLAAVLRQAAATVREAILAIADLGIGQRGAIERQDREREGMLPYALRPQRADFVRQSLGVQSLLHSQRLMAAGTVRREAVHVYLDVSGSMDPALPALYATLVSLADLLHPQVHLFSTRIDDIDLHQLARGVRVTTGGTSIAPVTRHALSYRVKRALFVTDGWVGNIPDEHSHALNRRGARFAAVVTQKGKSDFAAALRAKTWRLPKLEKLK